MSLMLATLTHGDTLLYIEAVSIICRTTKVVRLGAIRRYSTRSTSIRGDSGGPFILLAIAVHPPKWSGGWHHSLRLPSGHPSRGGKEDPVGSLYLGALYAPPDECVNNILHFCGAL